MTPKQLLLAFTLLLQACNDGLGEDAYEPDERESAMPLASGPYEDMLNRETGMVACVPPPPGIQAPWSGSQNLGAIAEFGPDSSNRQTVLKLDEWGPPEIWTLSLGIDFRGTWPITDPLVMQGYILQAEVSFGAGGATQLITVDWLQGVQLSMPMNSISVVAKYNSVSPALGYPVNPPDDLRLSAMLGRGSRSGRFPPSIMNVLTDGDFSVVGATRVQYLEIPPFAYELEILSPTADMLLTGNATTYLQEVVIPDEAAGLEYYGCSGQFLTRSLSYGSKIAIEPGATHIMLQQDGADACYIKTRFNLSL